MTGPRSRVKRAARAAVVSLTFAVLCLGPARGASTPPPAPPQFAATERIDQTPVNVWPRWTPRLSIDRQELSPLESAVTIDAYGTAHFVWSRLNANGKREVVYANDRWATRQLNGLSEPRVISRGSISGAGNPWIQAGPGDTVAAVWEEYRRVTSSSIGGSRTDTVSDVVRCLIVRNQPQAATAVEQGTYDFTPNPAAPRGTDILVRCYAPSVDLSARDTLGISYVRERQARRITPDDFPVDPQRTTKVRYYSPTQVPLIRTILAYVIPDAREQVDPDNQAEAWTQLKFEPPDPTLLNADGTPHVVWDISTNDAVQLRRVRHGVRKVDGTWEVSNPSTFGVGSRMITIASAEFGSVHVACSGAGVLYTTWTGGAWGAEEPLASAGTPRMLLDHKRRPVILCNDYLIKRNGAWTTRIVETPPSDAAMDGDGNAWVTEGGYYQHMQDPDLGSQDGFVQMGLGPAAATVVNGNLHTTIPLLSSNGIGLSLQLALAYNGQDATRGPVGQGWQTNYDMYVTMDTVAGSDQFGYAALVSFGDGRKVWFQRASDDNAVFLPREEFGDFSKLVYRTVISVVNPPPNYRSTLGSGGPVVIAGGGDADRIPILYSKQGTRFTFNQNGKLVEVMDLALNKLALTYSAQIPNSELLSSVVDTSQRGLGFTYDAAGHMKTITGPGVSGTARDFTLAYTSTDGKGQLANVTFGAAPVPHVWKFEYCPLQPPLKGTPDPPSPDQKEFGDPRHLGRVTTPGTVMATGQKPAPTPVDTVYFYQPESHRALGCWHATVPGPDASAPDASYGAFIVYNDATLPYPTATLWDRNANTGSFPSGKPVVSYDPIKCVAPQVDYPATADEPASRLVRTIGPYRNVDLVVDRSGYVKQIQYHREGTPQTARDYVRDNVKNVRCAGGGPDPVKELPQQTGTDFEYYGNLEPECGDAEPPMGSIAGFSPNFLKKVTSAAILDAGRPWTGYRYDRGTLRQIDYPGGKFESFSIGTGGRVDSWTDANQKVTGYGYTGPTGLPTQMTQGGSSTGVAYDDLGFVVKRTIPSLATIDYVRDGLDRIVKVTGLEHHGGGRPVWDMDYDPDGHLTVTIEPGDNGVRIRMEQAWDALGRIKRVADATNPSFGPLELRYDANGNQTYATDWARNPTTATYNGNDRLKTMRPPDASDGAPSFTYDPNGLTKTATLDSSTYAFDYDCSSNRVGTTYPQAQNQNRADVFNMNEEVFLSSFEITGSPLHAGVGYTRNARLQTTAVTALKSEAAPDNNSFNGATTNLYLGNEGEVNTVVDPAGVSMGQTYDDRYLTKDQSDGLGRVVYTTGHDADGNVVRTVTPDPTRPVGADALPESSGGSQAGVVGSIVQVKNDPAGNPYEITAADGTKTEVSYNARGQVKTVTRHLWNPVTLQRHSVITSYFYDTRARLQFRDEQKSVGVFLRWTYGYTAASGGSNDDVTSMTDPMGRQYRMDYDAAHRMKTYTYPDGRSERFDYNAKGLLWHRRHPGGLQETFVYDPRGRRTDMSCAVATVHWEQDEADRLTLASRTQNGVTVTQRFGYRGDDDPEGTLGRVHSSTTTLSGGAAGTVQSINYTYLANGQRDSMEIATPQGGTLEYAYTSPEDKSGKLGRLYGINRVASGGGKTRIVTYVYDAGGRVRSETCPETFRSVFRDYDIKGRVRRIRGGGIDVEYTYDTLDRRVKVEYHHVHVVWFFDYDDLGRLTHETCTGNAPGSAQAPASAVAARGPGNTSPLNQCELATAMPGGGAVPIPAYEYAFDFDDVGNRTAKRWVSGSQVFGNWRYEYNGPTNFLTDAYGLGGRHIAYTPDARGNQKTRTEQSVLEVYDFDEGNRLTSYFRQAGASVEALETYVYAPDGERIAVVDTSDPSTRVEKWYAFDGADVVADVEWTSASPNRNLKSTYVNGLGVDDKIARFQGGSSSAAAYYRRDALGSIITTTDGGGQVVNDYVTNAWGEDILPRPKDNANRYGFAGRENDEKSGNMHFRAREYDPASGRFLQNDPILGNRASEGYAYASGNPLSFTDPFGLDDEPGFLKRWWFGSWGATKNFGAFIRTGTWDWWTMSFNDDARMRIYAARANLAKSIDEHGALQALFIDSTIGEITAGADDYARGNYEQGMARATTGGTNGVFLVRGAVSGIRGGIRFVQGARANGFLATVRSSAGGFRAWATTPDASFKGNLGFDPADPFGFGRAFGQGFEEGAQDFARESTPPETVYRGVNAKHPFVDWAQQGYAVPKGQFKPDAHTSPGLHSDGNTESIFTSWTTDPKVAAWFAMKEGPGGVILIDRIPAGSGIRGGMIPAESEVIRQGIIGPVQVIMPEPLNVLSDDPAPASWQAR